MSANQYDIYLQVQTPASNTYVGSIEDVEELDAIMAVATTVVAKNATDLQGLMWCTVVVPHGSTPALPGAVEINTWRNHVLTRQDKAEMKKKYREGWTIQDLSESFHTTQAKVSRMVGAGAPVPTNGPDWL